MYCGIARGIDAQTHNNDNMILLLLLLLLYHAIVNTHLLIELQDVPTIIHVSELLHRRGVHVVRRTLGHHLHDASVTVALNNTLHFLERVRTDRTSTGIHNNINIVPVHIFLSVSLAVSSVKFSRLTRTDLNHRRSSHCA